jgi:lipopolysaccharide cholinephosphotransferase
MIPWDDDIDVGMLREDFDRFLALKSKYPDEYYIQDWLNDSAMPLAFVKIRRNGTRMLEDTSADVGGHKGIFIDVFPLDNVAESRFAFLLHTRAIRFLQRIAMHKCGYRLKTSRFSYRLIDMVAKTCSVLASERLVKASLSRLLGWFGPGKMVIAASGSYSPEKETFPRSWLTNARPMQFEGMAMPCPHPIEDYLSKLYGNYMALPPEEDRGTKHSVLELETGT